MNLDGYKTYIPLYILADYLGLHALCKDLISRLHRTNRRIAAHLQRALTDGKTIWPPKDWVKTFSECAGLAYSIPAQMTEADVKVKNPGGLRSIFVELFEFARFGPLDETLVSLSTTAPLLLVDVMMRMRLIEGARIPSLTTTCKQCGINPIAGTGASWPEAAPTPRQLPTTCQLTERSPDNFWVKDDLCFKCSLFYL